MQAGERHEVTGAVGARDAAGPAQRSRVSRGGIEHLTRSLEGDRRLGGVISHWLLGVWTLDPCRASITPCIPPREIRPPDRCWNEPSGSSAPTAPPTGS